MADVAAAPIAATDDTTKSRPEKPDEAKYHADLEKAEKEHELKMQQYVRSRAVSVLSLSERADSVPIERQKG